MVPRDVAVLVALPLQAPLCLPGTFSRSSCPFNSLASQFSCEAANQLVSLDAHFLFLLGFSLALAVGALCVFGHV